MVKNLNESRKDPERSASAKGRKPPPNPWQRIKDLEATLDKLQTATTLEAGAKARKIAELQTDVRHSTSHARAFADIVTSQATLINELSKPWFGRNSRSLQQARMVVTEAYRTLDRIKASLRNELERAAILPGELDPDAPGKIAGLEARGNTGAQQAPPRTYKDYLDANPSLNRPQSKE